MEKKEKDRIEAFGMRRRRRIKRIKCSDRVSSEDVMNRIKENGILLFTVIKRKGDWIRYMPIIGGKGTLTTVLEFTVEWERRT